MSDEDDDLIGRPPSAGHNSAAAAGEELRQFVERYVELEADKAAIAADQKEIMAEMKGRGYDTKIVRRLIAELKREPDDIAEEEAILEIYRAAMGRT